MHDHGTIRDNGGQGNAPGSRERREVPRRPQGAGLEHVSSILADVLRGTGIDPAQVLHREREEAA